MSSQLLPFEEVLWSACLPSTSTMRVQVLLKSTIFGKIVVEKNKIKQKEAGVLPILEQHIAREN